MDREREAPAAPRGPGSGELSARYDVIGRLAVGGMAELFLGRPKGAPANTGAVVIKRILPQLAEDPEFVRMFRDEAHLASTLDHPNIVRVFDIGTDGDEPFFTMEYVHGENLRTILRGAQARNEAIPLPVVLSIAVGVTAALHYAHERTDRDGRPLAIVHRDVSPTNVLVSQGGEVKIVDFGIAKAAAATHVTQAGMLKGKVSYMSPEQCRGEAVDRRSDVFALGILLYELTTLQRLFRGENELAILHQILTGTVPPPSGIVPGYPPQLEAILMRSLQVDPAGRYPTAAAMQADLEQLCHQLGVRPSAALLSSYLVERFGDKPLPWQDVPLRRVEGTGSEARVERPAPPRSAAAPAAVRAAAPTGAKPASAGVSRRPATGVQVAARAPAPARSGTETRSDAHARATGRDTATCAARPRRPTGAARRRPPHCPRGRGTESDRRCADGLDPGGPRQRRRPPGALARDRGADPGPRGTQHRGADPSPRRTRHGGADPGPRFTRHRGADPAARRDAGPTDARARTDAARPTGTHATDERRAGRVLAR
ncbi:MAG: protein kinase [Deltaproteobacteria bacterium]|nr:protein kinase [Deltaproteobacteria bacterium]